jgi:hypothetical protein
MKAKANNSCIVAFCLFTNVVLGTWPHIVCGNTQWKLDSRLWKDPKECLRRCRGDTLRQINQGEVTGGCVLEQGFAICDLDFRPV